VRVTIHREQFDWSLETVSGDRCDRLDAGSTHVGGPLHRHGEFAQVESPK
jgi:hypothetical protein